MTTPTRLSDQLRAMAEEYYLNPALLRAAADRLDTLERERDEALKLANTSHDLANHNFECANRHEAEVRRLTAALAQARTEE